LSSSGGRRGFFGKGLKAARPSADPLSMTSTACDRCEAKLDPAMNWCPRCLLPTPWAPDPAEVRAAEARAWPDIWGDAGSEDRPTEPAEERRVTEDPEEAFAAAGSAYSWSLSRVF